MQAWQKKLLVYGVPVVTGATLLFGSGYKTGGCVAERRYQSSTQASKTAPSFDLPYEKMLKVKEASLYSAHDGSTGELVDDACFIDIVTDDPAPYHFRVRISEPASEALGKTAGRYKGKNVALRRDLWADSPEFPIRVERVGDGYVIYVHENRLRVYEKVGDGDIPDIPLPPLFSEKESKHTKSPPVATAPGP